MTSLEARIAKVLREFDWGNYSIHDLNKGSDGLADHEWPEDLARMIITDAITVTNLRTFAK